MNYSTDLFVLLAQMKNNVEKNNIKIEDALEEIDKMEILLVKMKFLLILLKEKQIQEINEKI